MSWVLVIGGVWILLALSAAVLIGRSIHMADVAASGPEAADSVADPVGPLAETIEESVPAPRPPPRVRQPPSRLISGHPRPTAPLSPEHSETAGSARQEPPSEG